MSGSTDQRIADYFTRRAIEILEQAKAAEQAGDVIRQLDLERRVAEYWRIARGQP